MGGRGPPGGFFGVHGLRSGPAIGEVIKHDAEIIQAGTYVNHQSSVRICVRGFDVFVRQVREARINAKFSKFDLGSFAPVTWKHLPS